MKRKFLFALYQSPRGKLLKALETQYLKRSITVSCKQQQLQVGGLGWEDDFIDFSLYRKYCIFDSHSCGSDNSLRVQGRAFSLPFQSETIDLAILPHILEFDHRRFETAREIARVLKPGGEVIIINFNPYSPSVRYQFILDRQWTHSWRSHFIRCNRIVDWLNVMNFEILSTAEFYLDSYQIRLGKCAFTPHTLLSNAYAIKAVKREYTVIPVGKVTHKKKELAAARNIIETSSKKEQHWTK